MARFDYRDYVVSDPKICGGEPVMKGTRVQLRVIVASLAAGDSVSEILRDFPTLSEDHVRAAIAMAAEGLLEDLCDLAVKAKRAGETPIDFGLVVEELRREGKFRD